MNTYERMLELIVEISKEDLEYYKGRPSRKKVKKKKKKKKKRSAEAEEAAVQNKAFRTTSMKESTPIERGSPPLGPHYHGEGPHKIGKDFASIISAIKTQLAGGKKTFDDKLRPHHIESVKTQARKQGRAALKKNRAILARSTKGNWRHSAKITAERR